MKRLSLTIVLLTLAVLSGRTHAQKWYFYESFDNVAVDATGSGYIPEGFTLYNDGNALVDDLSYFDMAWKVIRGMNGEGYAAAPSLFKAQNAQADRWLITPAISLQGASAPKLYFRARSANNQARDGFVLKISTTTTDTSAFGKIRETREAAGTWTDYVFDLSDYKGKNVYIAFVQSSTSRQMIYIDDIRVGETTSGLGAACNNAHTPLYMIYPHEGSGLSFPISATLQNWSGTPITSARLCVRMDNGKIFAKTFTGMNLDGTKLAQRTFSFNYIPKAANMNAVFEIWFDQINDQNVSTDITKVNCVVAEEAELPYKQLVFEMFSSAICSGCGLWNKFFHGWDSAYGGNDASRTDGFVVAKFQVNIPDPGDPLVTNETEARCRYYNIGEAPTWILNGRKFTYRGGTVENLEKTTRAFLDSLAAFQRTASPIALQAKLNVDGKKLTTEIKSTVKLPVQGDYRLYVVLVEDSIHERAQVSNETEYYNIVRKMLPDSNGTPLTISQPNGADSEKTYAFTYTVGDDPRFYGSFDRVGVVAYIQNTATKEIIQAAYAASNGEWSQPTSWINDKAYPIDKNVVEVGDAPNESGNEAATDVRLYPNPVGETATLSFRPLNANRLTVSVINMQGRVMVRQTVQGGTDIQTMTLPTAGLTEGLYIVCIESADGRTSVKLLKK